MKIIGKGETNKSYEDTYLVSCTDKELANLIGYYYKGDDGCPKFNVGDEVNVSSMYNQLYHLKFHEQDIGRIKDNLVSMLDGLTMIAPMIKNITEETSK